MLWTTLRLNVGNTAAIVGFLVLPIIAFGNGSLNSQSPAIAASADVDEGRLELPAFRQGRNFMPSAAQVVEQAQP
jgi:hypothetical protein